MSDDHENEKVRDRDVTFKVTLKRLQERLLPEWDELPVLDEFEGTLYAAARKDARRAAANIRNNQERETIDAYLKQLVEQTEYDLPDALIEQEAGTICCTSAGTISSAMASHSSRCCSIVGRLTMTQSTSSSPRPRIAEDHARTA